jgi:transcriptional regulator
MKKIPEQAPVEARDTVRHEILAALEEGAVSARELSGQVGIAEKDVYEHLEHIRASLKSSGRRLVVRPAECATCGFLFNKRDRIKGPGRCPVCKSEHVHEPLFSVSREER